MEQIAKLLALKERRVAYWEKHGTLPGLNDLI
jgi:hypothetical protein